MLGGGILSGGGEALIRPRADPSSHVSFDIIVAAIRHDIISTNDRHPASGNRALVVGARPSVRVRVLGWSVAPPWPRSQELGE